MQQLFQILVVLALANPFCCCDAVDWLGAAAPEQTAAATSCCLGGAEEESGTQGHDRSECPHKAEQELVQASGHDFHLSRAGVDFPPVVFLSYAPVVRQSIAELFVEPVSLDGRSPPIVSSRMRCRVQCSLQV